MSHGEKENTEEYKKVIEGRKAPLEHRENGGY